MAERIFEFLSNLLKIGKEQLFLKSTFLRDKVPIKPVLGLTGLGVLFMAVRPLLSSSDDPSREEEEINFNKELEGKGYTIQKTLYLMKEKEKLLKRQETDSQKTS